MESPFQLCFEATVGDTLTIAQADIALDLDGETTQFWFAVYSAGCQIGCFEYLDPDCESVNACEPPLTQLTVNTELTCDPNAGNQKERFQIKINQLNRK